MSSQQHTGVFLIDNVAKYEDGVVYILDRRVYPFEVRWERCDDVDAVAAAIRNMVTQSRGPGPAAGLGMVQAARVAEQSGADLTSALESAGDLLIAARPTGDLVRYVVECIRHNAPKDSIGAERAVLSIAEQLEADSAEMCRRMGETAAALLPSKATILTHCWAETGIVDLALAARDNGVALHVFCTETRPFLQGARLTADALADTGATVTIVTDGMPAHLMSEGLIDFVFTGTDRVTRRGDVVNKIGTLPIALAAARFGVPVYSLCARPDLEIDTATEVPIEMRTGEEVLEVRGVRTATRKADGLYPAFDRTPCDLVRGIVTERGLVAPDGVAELFSDTGRAVDGRRD